MFVSCKIMSNGISLISPKCFYLSFKIANLLTLKEKKSKNKRKRETKSSLMVLKIRCRGMKKERMINRTKLNLLISPKVFKKKFFIKKYFNFFYIFSLFKEKKKVKKKTNTFLTLFLLNSVACTSGL